MKGYFDTIPVEIEEAAQIDGASGETDPYPDRPAFGKTCDHCHGGNGIDLCME